MKNLHSCKRCHQSYSHKRKSRPGKYCSRACRYADMVRSTEPNTFCSWCNKHYYRNPKRKRTKTGFTFCSRLCKDTAQRIKGLDGFTPSHYGSTEQLYSHVRQEIRNKHPFCAQCNYSSFPRVLHIHHIDRDRGNNNRSNLLVLCPTCHAEDHYKAKDGPFAHWKKALLS